MLGRDWNPGLSVSGVQRPNHLVKYLSLRCTAACASLVLLQSTAMHAPHFLIDVEPPRPSQFSSVTEDNSVHLAREQTRGLEGDGRGNTQPSAWHVRASTHVLWRKTKTDNASKALPKQVSVPVGGLPLNWGRGASEAFLGGRCGSFGSSSAPWAGLLELGHPWGRNSSSLLIQP